MVLVTLAELVMLWVWFCRLFIKKDETQATYTAKQQRDGVATTAFIVAGVWRPRGSQSVPERAADLAVDAAADLTSRALAGDAAPGVGGGGAGHNDAPVVAERAAVGTAAFDWEAYRAVWADTPIDEAITAMFAEFAVLHAQLSGSVRSTSPPPLTIAVGRDIADRAERFVLQYVTPILGKQNSTKVHKLLCHVMEAIRMHGNFVNGNSGVNESLHKGDKAYYARTTKDIARYTRQLVVQAQGARRIQQRNIVDDQAAMDVGAEGDEDAWTGDEGADDDASADENDAPASRSERRRPSVYHLPLVSLAHLSSIAGLHGIEDALGLGPDDHVRLISRVRVTARFDDDRTAPQLLYAAASFRGSPWYDTVLYSPAADSTHVCVGEIRALVRRPSGDVAVLADMVAVEPVARCSLVARGCTRLAWHVPDGESDVRLRAVPLASIRRAIHVVPDFRDLAHRRGWDAEPAAWSSPREERLAMRYFLNDFYVWG